MLLELGGKQGKLCQLAAEGKLRCPLILRSNAEDAVTATVMSVLKVLQPRWVIPDLLNAALGVNRFDRRHLSRFRIDLWQNRPMFPVELLGWREGSSQIEVTMRWEGQAPTTAFWEFKYESPLSPKTANGDPTGTYPSDQLIRNVRVGLLECGWYERFRLFDTRPRDFVQVLVAPTRNNPLVAKYRDRAKLLASIPHADKLRGLPRSPFVGELSFTDIAEVLRCQRRFLTTPERRLIDQLVAYLSYKTATLRTTPFSDPATPTAPTPTGPNPTRKFVSAD
jgi:hypothetical protein